MQRTGIETPAEVIVARLRHNFSSNFKTNGSNILILQRILGPTEIKVTMRYAHFAPDNLAESLLLNRLSHIQSK